MTDHGLDRAKAIAHYNAEYRHRFRLRALRGGELPTLPPMDHTLGLPDPACAAIAAYLVSRTPRYAWGTVINGDVIVGDEHLFPPGALQGSLVLVENPIGNDDNWSVITRWYRAQSKRRREEAVAGLAIVEDAGRWDSPADPSAIGIPPDEILSGERLGEVAYVYGVSEETVRNWRDAQRHDRKRKRAGPPRRK